MTRIGRCPALIRHATRGPAFSMGLVSVATTAAWKFVALLGYAAIYTYLAPWHLSATRWYTWLIAILGVDLLYYCYHRMAHRVRLVWATHQAHHSSQYFNLATALRQKWNNSGEILMWTPVAAAGRTALAGVRQLFAEPHLPVLGAHRTHRQAVAAGRIPAQHSLPPPGTPRYGRRISRQELRRNTDRLGSTVRHFSRRTLPAALRVDQPMSTPSTSGRCRPTNIWRSSRDVLVGDAPAGSAALCLRATGMETRRCGPQLGRTGISAASATPH